MSDFFAQLEDGEEMVFGVVTSTHTTSVSVGGAQVSSRASERRLGITNRRVIIESGDDPAATHIIPNADVRRVFIQREKFMGELSITITELETASGQTIQLDMGGLEPQEKPLIQQTFPNAEIKEKRKGLLGFLGLG